jgi:hypothetical protein
MTTSYVKDENGAVSTTFSREEASAMVKSNPYPAKLEKRLVVKAGGIS